jgi:hypothetical protein
LTDPGFTPILRVKSFLTLQPISSRIDLALFLRKLGHPSMEPYFIWHLSVSHRRPTFVSE